MEETVCHKCGNVTEDDHTSKISYNTNEATIGSDTIAKCERWLQEKCSLRDCDSEYSSQASFSSAGTSQGQTETECSCDVESSTVELMQPEPFDDLDPEQIGSLIIKSEPNTYGKVSVKKSKHVIIGNVTYVTGPVHITQASSTFNQQSVVNQVFLDGTSATQKSNKLTIISRLHWLAQPPLRKNFLPEPVRYVVIGHTATEEGFTQAENTLLVRLVQTFHIESRKWDDIAYNFLIGSDGHVYQGRGWGYQGAHTYGYNQKSVGISFIGCFMDHLPPPSALNAAKSLIQLGIELGHIPEDYTLVGHCQCSPVESPGRALYDEIKTWPMWRELTSNDTT